MPRLNPIFWDPGSKIFLIKEIENARPSFFFVICLLSPILSCAILKAQNLSTTFLSIA